eukprot:GHRR01028609.1.p1 GENE.GHRR01028609.1~~GHRR01028609.1.p1  ORF type:complete len:179 (+),score=60.92 GHRR01028609.1:316-852(+)
MAKQRNLRKKRSFEEPEDDEITPEVQKELLEDLKLLQKQRKRVAGVDVSKLIAATTAAADEEGTGTADNELMDAQYVKAEGTAKSQILDEETHMQMFVERELARRLGRSVDENEQKLSKQQQEELELYRLPEGLQVRHLAVAAMYIVSGHCGPQHLYRAIKIKELAESWRLHHLLLQR